MTDAAKPSDAPPPSVPSAYSRLPDETLGARARRTGERVRSAVHDGAEELEERIGEGLSKASRALAAPAGTEVEGLLGQADLPELTAGDALGDLARRLDREGDLWRNLALRELARLAWADRIAQIVAVLAVVGDAALGVIAAIGALLGGDNAGGRALLLAAAAIMLAAGAVIVAWVCAAVRKTQREVAREALNRADLAELRLHRIGIVLAWRKADPTLFQDALARLERDAGAPPR